MTLYFENPVSFLDSGSISINGIWHPNDALLAVSSYSQDRGGFVTVFDEHGQPNRDVEFPSHRSFQVTALAWHPEYIILATGWENGEFKIWNGSDKEFQNVGGPHKAPITLLEFSEKGERLASCDSSGSLVGWRVDSKGQTVLEFHLELKEAITHLAFRITIKPKPEYDVEGLARAAVNGDEHALDLFSNWRPKTTARKFRVHEGSTNLSFFVGTQAGSIYYITTKGTEVLNTEGTPLSYVIHHPQRDSLIVMMEGLTVGHFSIDSQGHLTELAKVKLSGKIQSRSMSTQGLTWAGNSCLAVLTGDLIVRIWDIDTNDNYVLPTNLKLYDNDDKRHTLNEIFTCLAYCKINQTLCAGTNIGRIYFWSRVPNKMIFENPEDCWELNNINIVAGTVKQLMWGATPQRVPLLSVNCVTSYYIMKEEEICACFSEKIWAIQKTTTQILFESEHGNHLLQLDEQANNMTINENYAVFTNGRTARVYTILWENTEDTTKPNFSLKFTTSFLCESEKIILHNKNLIVLTTTAVHIKTFTGSILHSFMFNASEGEPIGIDLTGNYLTIFTIEGYLKIYDLSENSPKLITPAKYLPDVCMDFGEIIQAKTNCRGNKVAMTLAASNLIPDGKLYIWDIESDSLVSYDFQKNSRQSLDDYDSQDLYNNNFDVVVEEKDTQNDDKQLFDEICTDRLPLFLFWDDNDPRLLICNAKRLPKFSPKFQKNRSKGVQMGNAKQLQEQDHIVVTMFISAEHGIKIHDIKGIETEAKLFGLSTPYIIIIEKLSIVRELMSDFVGLTNSDKDTRNAVLDFSYNLTLGNMDAAFKAIKLVQSPGVWNSLARMCVKTQRLDVAGVCLGHMGNARAAMLLRNAMNDPNLPYEAKLAVLAVQLGMLDEAEQFYVQCGRYDLLNKLQRSRNRMDVAHSVASTHDRIHLKNTEHAWAKSLEQVGDYQEACARYEKANTHRFDIPRMLLDQPQQLEAYMVKTKDPELLKWWGQYMESQGEMQAALKTYATANDTYSQVRIYCYLGEESKAADLARKGNDKAAFYHMARFYETTGDHENAVNFFTRANAYSNAIRLCKEKHMSEELWDIGIIASSREKLECARYFEEINALDRAIILYHRAGMLHKAFDLAFKTQQFDTLQQIATDLDATSDPALVEKCAQYFVHNEQFDKAVDLLAIAKKYTEAIVICMEHNVELTEDLVEKLTPDKDQLDEENRIKVLETLADSLMMQGNYHLATKKYTQAGDKIRAMKALLKSGDTEKIIFFAGVSRQRDIYIMAANYLQSLDWQNNPEVLRNIITFYSKGKALDLLANFYVACAQVEIDEFKNYEKAFGALTEAAKCLTKIANPRDPIQHRRAADIVQQRLELTKKFIDVKRLFDRGDFQAGLTQSRQLLMTDSKDLEAAVRRGDIYALIIQESVKNNRFDEAKQSFMELRQMLTTTGSTPITYYLSKEVVEVLARNLGLPVATLLPAKINLEPDSGETNDFVEEETVE